MTNQRIWRLRKLHQFVDAELEQNPDSSDVELRVSFNGELSYTKLHASRQSALEEANAKRADLERQGWMFHW